MLFKTQPVPVHEENGVSDCLLCIHINVVMQVVAAETLALATSDKTMCSSLGEAVCRSLL